MGHLRGEELLAALLTNASRDVLKNVELSMNAIVNSLPSFEDLPAAVYTIAVGFHHRFLSVGVFHFGIPGTYAVMIISHESLFAPHTT